MELNIVLGPRAFVRCQSETIHHHIRAIRFLLRKNSTFLSLGDDKQYIHVIPHMEENRE